MKPPGWKRAIPGAAVGFFFRNSQFIYTFNNFCANNFFIPDQTGAYNIESIHPFQKLQPVMRGKLAYRTKF